MTNEPSQQRERITAAELMNRLRQDPAFVEREQEHERRQAAAQAAYRQAAGPLLAELAEVGFPVSAVGELRNEFQRSGQRYEAVIPILLRWLPRITYRPLEDDIVHTLAVPWAKQQVARPLIERFRSLPPHDGEPWTDPHWNVGDALERVVHQDVADDLLDLAQDRRFGDARRLVVLGLAKLKRDPRVVPALIRLLDDPDVSGFAIDALGRLKASEARERLEGLLDHPEREIRVEARKALRKIDKASEPNR